MMASGGRAVYMRTVRAVASWSSWPRCARWSKRSPQERRRLKPGTCWRPEARGGSSRYTLTDFRHWSEADGDCQDTRAEVLIADSRVTPTFTSSRHCSVARGKWIGPWDYATWTNPADVDIDHLVALKEVWESGARIWGPVNRQHVANDKFRYALDVVTDNVNASKGDPDPAEWLPSSPPRPLHLRHPLGHGQVPVEAVGRRRGTSSPLLRRQARDSTGQSV